MSLYQDPESRSKRKPETSAPLFEQSFYKFEQHKVADQLSRVVIGKRDKEDGVPREYAPSSPAQGIAHARRNDPATSKAAARSVTNITGNQQIILGLLSAFGPMTDEQIIARFHASQYPAPTDAGIRSRRCELVRLGLVEDSGKLGKTAANRPCMIWRLK